MFPEAFYYDSVLFFQSFYTLNRKKTISPSFMT